MPDRHKGGKQMIHPLASLFIPIVIGYLASNAICCDRQAPIAECVLRPAIPGKSTTLRLPLPEVTLSLVACGSFRGGANGQAQPAKIKFSILPDPPVFRTWNEDRLQLFGNPLRIFQPPQMRIA
jgi:hypothetical protein